MPPVRRLALLAFVPLLVGWTWLLVRPNPIPEVVEAVPSGWRYLAAKCLHAGGYATLAVLGGVWPGSAGGRTVVWAALAAHGVGTEVIQTFVPRRSGSVVDVLIDATGVTVGTAVWRWVVRDRLPAGPVVPPGPQPERAFFRSF